MAEFNDENYRELPPKTSQQIIKALFINIKSWQKSRKEWNNNTHKFLGRPKMPRYKKELSEVYFTNQQVTIKRGHIHFPKKTGIEPIKTNVTNIDCCRIIPKSNHFVVEFVYTDEEKKIITGPAMIPNKDIYRFNWLTGEEYNVFFSPETVAKIAQNFLINHNQNNVTLGHQLAVNNVYTIESWIVNDPQNS